MSILIDTHVFLWAAGVAGRLSDSAEALLTDPDSEIFLSAASAWEVSIKWSKRRLELPAHPDEVISKVVTIGGISRLPISFADACAVADLPFHHRDPFDRLLIAQAKRNGLRIMTANSIFERYDVDVIALWLDDADE